MSSASTNFHYIKVNVILIKLLHSVGAYCSTVPIFSQLWFMALHFLLHRYLVLNFPSSMLCLKRPYLKVSRSFSRRVVTQIFPTGQRITSFFLIKYNIVMFIINNSVLYSIYDIIRDYFNIRDYRKVFLHFKSFIPQQAIRLNLSKCYVQNSKRL